MPPRYTARFEFDEEAGRWNASIAEVPGVVAFGRPLKKARERLRDAFAEWLDDDSAAERAVFVEDVLEAPSLTAAIAASNAAREELARAQAEANRALRVALDRLVEHGYTMRQASERLGVSFQRVGQLVRGGSKRLPIATAAAKLDVTPIEYRSALADIAPATGAADAYGPALGTFPCLPYEIAPRSVTKEAHQRVQRALRKKKKKA